MPEKGTDKLTYFSSKSGESQRIKPTNIVQSGAWQWILGHLSLVRVEPAHDRKLTCQYHSLADCINFGTLTWRYPDDVQLPGLFHPGKVPPVLTTLYFFYWLSTNLFLERYS